MAWRLRRQIVYGIGYIFILVLVFGTTVYAVSRKNPTCADGKKNQNELGVDCGGACAKICAFSVAAPVVAWQKVFKVSQNNYSAAAYIQNSNLNAEVLHAPYTFTIYGKNGEVIETRKGVAYIPTGASVILESRITSNNNDEPVRASLAFGKLDWQKNPSLTPVVVSNPRLLNTTTDSVTPEVDADITNNSLNTLARVNVSAVVYDTDNNAVGVGGTYFENLARGQSRHVAFTWPQPFVTDLTSCAKPIDVALAIDRSGSMTSDGKNPPEPLTSVKNAAEEFIGKINQDSKASIISFATTPSLDAPLTSSIPDLQSAANSITIHTNGTQYTNIADTIKMAINQLDPVSISPTDDTENGNGTDRNKAIILLTDGVANYPDPTNPSAALEAAVTEAATAKADGIEIFTIGLGSDVSANFLQTISSDAGHFYQAANSFDVAAIYNQISSSICNKQPVKVEVIPVVVPSVN